MREPKQPQNVSTKLLFWRAKYRFTTKQIQFLLSYNSTLGARDFLREEPRSGDKRSASEVARREEKEEGRKHLKGTTQWYVALAKKILR